MRVESDDPRRIPVAVALHGYASNKQGNELPVHPCIYLVRFEAHIVNQDRRTLIIASRRTEKLILLSTVQKTVEEYDSAYVERYRASMLRTLIAASQEIPEEQGSPLSDEDIEEVSPGRGTAQIQGSPRKAEQESKMDISEDEDGGEDTKSEEQEEDAETKGDGDKEEKDPDEGDQGERNPDSGEGGGSTAEGEGGRETTGNGSGDNGSKGRDGDVHGDHQSTEAQGGGDQEKHVDEDKADPEGGGDSTVEDDLVDKVPGVEVPAAVPWRPIQVRITYTFEFLRCFSYCVHILPIPFHVYLS